VLAGSGYDLGIVRIDGLVGVLVRDVVLQRAARRGAPYAELRMATSRLLV
jgi:hypothetical protein